ncbi:glycosyltransferase [Alteromonas sp. CYL-A6]|uniref:glycosyltransferase n=1 Tax=Alteromonas nitratireducens TaxID=3390813 RepID=UPI0034AFE9E5
MVDFTSLTWLFSLWKLSRKYDRVIFHTHSYYGNIPLYLLTIFRPGRRWIKTEHRLGHAPVSSWKRWIRRLLRTVNAGPTVIIGVSDAVTARNRALHGEVVTTIHNGISDVSTPYRRKPRTPEKALYVGRLTPEKGIDNLVNAFSLLAKDNDYNALTLTVVGTGPSFEPLQKFILENGLSERIRLVGYQEDPSPYYKDADFLIVPTQILEACPLVTLEARRFGLPALYANRGGMRETAGKGATPLTGLSPQALCESIKAFADNPKAYITNIEKTRLGLSYFSIERMADEYVALYEHVFSGRYKALFDQPFKLQSQAEREC